MAPSVYTIPYTEIIHLSEYYNIDGKQIKRDLTLWPKLNHLNRKDELILNVFGIGHVSKIPDYLYEAIIGNIMAFMNEIRYAYHFIKLKSNVNSS